MDTNDNPEVFELLAENVIVPPSISAAGIGKSGVNMNDDRRVSIDWDSRFVRGFFKLCSGPFLGRPMTSPPGYSELAPQSANDTIQISGPPLVCPESLVEIEKNLECKQTIVIQASGAETTCNPLLPLETYSSDMDTVCV